MKSWESESYTSWLLLLNTVFYRLIHVVLCVGSVSFCDHQYSIVWLASLVYPFSYWWICGVLFTSAAMDFSKEGNNFSFEGVWKPLVAIGLKSGDILTDRRRSLRRTTWVKILCLCISLTFKSYWPQSVFRNQSKLHH